MKVQVSNDIYKMFEALIQEYFSEQVIFDKDPTAYIKSSDFIIGGTLDPSSKEEYEEINKKIEKGIPTVRQLHKNKKTVGITNVIAEKLIRSNQLRCFSHEVCNLVDRITFKYINDIISQHPLPDEEFQKSELTESIYQNIAQYKSGLLTYEFKFPVYVIGLEDTVKLYESIFLLKENSLKLEGKAFEQYMWSRAFEPNYCIHIVSNVKSSYEYSKERAIRAKEATINILLCLYGYKFGVNSCNGPFIKGEDYNPHFLNYFLSGKRGGELEDNRSYHFNYNDKYCSEFWSMFKGSFSEQASLHKVLFSIPEKILSNDNFDQSVCYLVERSLRWFSDAINENNKEMKIVKLTIAIESLVNFKSDSKTSVVDAERFKETFVRRVSNINNVHDDVIQKATELYNARSTIAHGSTLKKRFSFDITEFAATTILLTIQLYSMFKDKGLDEVGFGGSLPKFIDDFCQTPCSLN